jgi:mono/diheme cytochrome c family protein
MSKIGRVLGKVAKWAGLGLVVLGLGLTVAVALGERKIHEAPFPAVAASQDPAVIARGRYLVYGPAHCVDCHGAPDRIADAAQGKPVPLSGGVEMKLPVGIFRPGNITPDVETGIGGLSDQQIARSLRFGVRHDGKAMLPFMPFADMSNADLIAVISFLRAEAPVRSKIETRSPNLLGRIVAALVIKPIGPTGPILDRVAEGVTPEYGKYLAHSVANCVGCHTERDLRTGEFTGPVLAGGLEFPSEKDPNTTFVTPNLTFAKTGRITNWTDEVFLARVRTGKGPEGTPMPWASFARMSDADLRAVYLYLKSLPPVENDTGASVRGPTVAQAAPK